MFETKDSSCSRISLSGVSLKSYLCFSFTMSDSRHFPLPVPATSISAVDSKELPFISSSQSLPVFADASSSVGSPSSKKKKGHVSISPQTEELEIQDDDDRHHVRSFHFAEAEASQVDPFLIHFGLLKAKRIYQIQHSFLLPRPISSCSDLQIAQSWDPDLLAAFDDSTLHSTGLLSTVALRVQLTTRKPGKYTHTFEICSQSTSAGSLSSTAASSASLVPPLSFVFRVEATIMPKGAVVLFSFPRMFISLFHCLCCLCFPVFLIRFRYSILEERS